jgi:hypothetical protein
MAELHVISALRKKRAELAGEVVTAQLRLGKLRDDLDAIDRTLRVFDPSQHAEKIRLVVKRKGDRMFGYGECTRAILNAPRDARAMTTADLVERVALDLSDLDGSTGRRGDAGGACQGRAGETGQARSCERGGEAMACAVASRS